MKRFSVDAVTVSRTSALLRWLVVLLIVLAGSGQALKLQLNDDALDLLPGEAVRGDLALLQRLGLVNRLFLTLTVSPSFYGTEAEALAALKEGTTRAGEAMAAADLFAEVIYRFPADFEWTLFQELEPHLPALLSREDLAGLASMLTDNGLEQLLQDGFALLNSPAGLIVKRQVQRDPLGLMPIVLQKLSHLKNDFAGTVADGFFISGDNRSTLLLAESTKPLTDSKSAREVQQLLRTVMVDSLPAGVEWRVIGSLPHTLANADSIQRDLRLLLPLATMLLLTLLLVTLKDFRALLVLGIPFLAAPAAIAAMGMLYGRVSALALGFGIVLIGIAVDFSVHIYLAFARESGSRQQILQRLLRPVALATLSTAGVFLVLLFSNVPSHRQMATLALTGILLAVAFSWLLLPTMITKRQTAPASWFKVPSRLPLRWRVIAIALWGALLAAGILSWPQLRYNGDLRVLDAPDAQVLADEEHFRATWQHGGDQAFLVAAGSTLAEALNHNFQVYERLQQAGFQRFQSIAPLLPGPGAQAQQVAAWNNFWEARRDAFPLQFAEAAGRVGFAPGAFQPFLQRLTDPPEAMAPEKIMQGPLQPLLATMLRLPEQQGTGRDAQEILLLTTVDLTAESMPLLLAIADDHPSITVLANQKWRQQVEALLRHDMAVLATAAAALIMLLALVAFRRLQTVLAVLAPVMSALAAMILFSRITTGELNMMHLLMGIMVIGLSVDYGIFVACGRGGQVAATTFLAVSICAASSLLGFGVLAFAQHPALHSLGVTVLCGIGAAWPTALLISPILAGNPETRSA
jgi:uncharacterized protein